MAVTLAHRGDFSWAGTRIFLGGGSVFPSPRPSPRGRGSKQIPSPSGRGTKGEGANNIPSPSGRGTKGEGAKTFPLPLGEGQRVREQTTFPLPLGEGQRVREQTTFPLPLGEGQRVREEKNEKNTQFGRFYTNLTFDNRPTPLPFFSRLFFISRSLFLAILFLRGIVRRAISLKKTSFNSRKPGSADFSVIACVATPSPARQTAILRRGAGRGRAGC